VKRRLTGIDALDLVVGGGIPEASCVVIAGGPGTCKTILAQQICFANARAGGSAIYFTTLSEPHSKLVDHLSGFSFFDRALLGDSVEFQHLGALADDGDAPSIANVSAEVVRQAFERRPSVIVIDSSKAIHEADEGGFRNALYELSSRVALSDALLILVGEYGPEDMRSAAEFSVADVIIELANESEGLTDRRWLHVAKLRGSSYLGGKHVFTVGDDGIALYPRPESTPCARVLGRGRRLSSGVFGLDEMMGGGLPEGTATIVAGPSGAGKSVLSLQFLDEGLSRGEGCVYASFQEGEAQLRAKAASFGWGLDKAPNAGKLKIIHVEPVELGVDIVAAQLHAAAREIGAQRVVIDSIAELAHATDRARFPDLLWALVSSLRSLGCTVFLTSETAAFFGAAFELASGLSFVADNIILLRYAEFASQIHRALVVVKMRDSDHRHNLVEFEINHTGARVKGAFEGVTGVLSGTPVPTAQKFADFFGK
jgi:circadian clock protein KaiC